jgi:hypothetical protein
MTYGEQKFEFCKQMEKEGVPYDIAARTIYYANLLQNYAVKACNEPLTAYDEKLEDSTQRNIVAILQPYNVEVDLNGDPRGGSVVKLKLPSGTWNDMGGPPLYIVPTRG